MTMNKAMVHEKLRQMEERLGIHTTVTLSDEDRLILICEAQQSRIEMLESWRDSNGQTN